MKNNSNFEVQKKKNLDMKIVKRIILAIFLLVAILFAVIYFYKDTLIKKFVTKFNRDYNIEIAYNSVDFSVLRSFPDATLILNDLKITTEKPFENDTLFYSKKIYLDLNIKDIFKKNADKINIKDILIENAKVNLKINKNGLANYEVKYLGKKTDINSDTKTNSDNNNDLTFSIKKYQIINTNIIFEDIKASNYIELTNFNHRGSGNFNASTMDLSTKTNIDAFTVKMSKITYLSKAKINLDAIFGINFNTMKFVLKENTLQLNDLILKLNGFVQHNKTNEEMDLIFSTPKANFKSILSLIPNAYSTDFKGVKANGITNISGFVKGKYSDTEMPIYAIKIKTNNASFKYPNLPKSVTNISFNGSVINNSKYSNPFLDITNLKFTIDQDTFETKGKITNLTKNPTVDASFNGTLNLENLSKAYPIQLEQKLTGVLKANVMVKADKKSVETNKFDNIKTNGTASLQDFSYTEKDLANPVYIKNANISFKTNSIKLTDFNAKTGKSDVIVTGTLDNLFAFMFDEKKLKGNFYVQSNTFAVRDFLVEDSTVSKIENKDEDETSQFSSENLKIPDFLDIITTFKVKKVLYNDLELSNVSGKMKIKEQQAILQNTKAQMMQGKVVFNGVIDTKTNPSKFDLDLNIDKFDIVNSFSQMETFEKIVPIAKMLKGKFDSSFKIKGNLNNDFTPDLNSLSGNALTEVFVNNLDENKSPLFSALTSNLNFIDLKKLNLKKLKATLSFKNGKVHVNPFALKYKDIKINVSGNHSFDTSLNYEMKLDLPAKYLGKDAITLLSKLSPEDMDTIRIPLSTKIGGNLIKPNVKANIKQVMTDLTLKIAKYQKDRLINQATNQVSNQINSALGNVLNSKEKDSTKGNNSQTNDVIKEGVNDLLNGIFKKKKKKKK